MQFDNSMFVDGEDTLRAVEHINVQPLLRGELHQSAEDVPNHVAVDHLEVLRVAHSLSAVEVFLKHLICQGSILLLHHSVVLSLYMRWFNEIWTFLIEQRVFNNDI